MRGSQDQGAVGWQVHSRVGHRSGSIPPVPSFLEPVLSAHTALHPEHSGNAHTAPQPHVLLHTAENPCSAAHRSGSPLPPTPHTPTPLVQMSAFSLGSSGPWETKRLSPADTSEPLPCGLPSHTWPAASPHHRRWFQHSGIWRAASPASSSGAAHKARHCLTLEKTDASVAYSMSPVIARESESSQDGGSSWCLYAPLGIQANPLHPRYPKWLP